MTTSIVTGGAGFLGSHLCRRLLDEGHRVIAVDNLVTGKDRNMRGFSDHPSFRFLRHDVSNPLFVDDSVDTVLHFASPASPIDYLELPIQTLKVGSLGTHNMLGLARAKGASFFLASTSEVYGDPLVHPQREDYWGNVNPVGPRGVYDEAKRFAEAMTAAYHRVHGLDTRIVRIFNSITADEQVLYDDGRELRRERVEELAARLASRAVVAGYHKTAHAGGSTLLDTGLSQAVEYPLDDMRVPAFTARGRIVAAPAMALIAHPSEQACFEVTTRYGRSIKVTGDHSIFVEGMNGEPVAKPVCELRVGDRIAIARRIDVPVRDRTEINMLDVWRFAERDPWDLLVEAPNLGRLVWGQRQDLFGLLVSERRNNGPNWRNGAWSKLIRMRDTDRVPLPVLRRIACALPEGARVRMRHAGRSVPLPARIQITDELLWLLGLYVAEGCTHETDRNAYVKVSGSAELLDRATAIIEDTFGLRCVRQPADEKRSAGLFVHSKLLLRVLDFLGLEANRKRIPGWILGLPLSRLKWFVEGYREGDGVHSGVKLDEGVRHEFSTVHDELKDDLIVACARFGLVPSVGRYETTFKQRTGDRKYPFWRLTLAHVTPWSPLEWDRGVEQRLQARTHGDLVWAPIRTIEEIEATPLVYDFSVPELENFWAGTGILAKNTYGPRMRPHDGRVVPAFIQQALAGEPLTVFGDGSQTRSFCYVDDLIEGIWRLLNADGAHDPVNLGNPGEMTILEFAERILELTGSASEISYRPLPEDDPKVRQPDIGRARELLGWEPRVPLAEGLARTIEYFRELATAANAGEPA